MIEPSEISTARHALGRQLAAYRKAAGLNQHQLAPHTHYGRSTIANVETGRQNVGRSFWARCDQALNAGGLLLSASERLDALIRRQRKQAADAEFIPKWRQPWDTAMASPTARGEHFLPEIIGRISSVLLSPTVEHCDSEDGPDLGRLAARVTAAWDLRQRARYATLGENLTVLIPDIECSAASLAGDDQRAAQRLAVHTYNAASSLLKRLGDCELALLAADRAVRTAATVDDPVLKAAASYRLANVLLSAARFNGATEVALRAADSIEPGKARTPLSLASWGGLLLTAAVAAASVRDEPRAWELIGEARAASRMLRVEYADIHTIFGPTNVAVHSVQVAAEMGNGPEVVTRAERVDANRFPASLAERRGQFLIDMARGYSLIARDDDASFSLLRAERAAPEEVRFNSGARELVHTLLGRERRGAMPSLRELAERIGVTD